MKNLFLLAVFVVTWNEYVLRYQGDDMTTNHALSVNGIDVSYSNGPIYSVEMSTRSVRLATERDADIFLGTNYENTPPTIGLIPINAFNIRMEKKQ